jgi:hypothetical protein
MPLRIPFLVLKPRAKFVVRVLCTRSEVFVLVSVAFAIFSAKVISVKVDAFVVEVFLRLKMFPDKFRICGNPHPIPRRSLTLFLVNVS